MAFGIPLQTRADSRAVAATAQHHTCCIDLTGDDEGEHDAALMLAGAMVAPGSGPAPATAAPAPECSICSAVVASEQAGCRCPAGTHLTCSDCFDGWTKAQCDQTSDDHAPHDLGNIWCPCKPGPGGKGCASEVPFAASVIVRHIKPDTLNAYLEARTFAAVAQRNAEQQQLRQANTSHNPVAAVGGGSDPTVGPRHHILEEILTLRCPRCRQAFCDWNDCLALKCKCGAGFCAVCQANCGRDAHAHVREQCAFIHLRGHATADQATAQQAQNAWRVSKLRQYLASFEPGLRAQIMQSVRRELLDLELPADDLATAPGAFPVAIDKLPEHWSAAGAAAGEVSFVSVAPGSQEWRSVVGLAGDTAPLIIAVTRVQNAALWDAYATQRSVLERKYAVGLRNGALRVDASTPGAAPAIVQSLWHGTRGTDPHALARSGTGFCASFARDKSSWGRGVYFSRHAALAHKYAHPRGAAHCLMIFADVHVGASGEAAPAATRPPPLDASHPWHEHLAHPSVEHRCDSATPSKVRKQKAMFVTFGVGAALAYPKYIVTLKERCPRTRIAQPLAAAPQTATRRPQTARRTGGHPGLTQAQPPVDY